MFDKIFYKFLGLIDILLSKIEKPIINFSTWIWHKRLNILNKKRGRKK